jgi:integrase
MSKDKERKTWSIARIKHPKYPEFTVRVGEYVDGGVLQVFRMVDKKLKAKSLKCRRAQLGSTPKAQEQEARRLACVFIEALANPTSVLGPPGTAGKPLIVGALIDRYALDGFSKTAPSYKKGSLAALRRVAAFLETDLLARDIKPSHIEKYLASRIAKKHAPAGRSDLIALSICCGWAVGEGLLVSNPLAAKRARDAMRIEHKVQRPDFTQAEFDKLKAVAPQLPPAFGIMLDLAWGTGRRIGAILGLRWADVYFEPDAAYAKCKDLDGYRWPVSAFANGGIRWYAGQAVNKKREDFISPMPIEVRDALLLWKQHTLGIGTRLLFPTPTDASRVVHRNVTQVWLRRAEKFADLTHQDRGGWHSFRRGWATKRKSFPLVDVARAGGWKNLQTMLRSYQQPDDDSMLAVINA